MLPRRAPVNGGAEQHHAMEQMRRLKQRRGDGVPKFSLVNPHASRSAGMCTTYPEFRPLAGE